MKALVTGASGFTGSHLARHLLRSGYEVRALVRPTSSLRALEGLPLEYVRTDLAAPLPLEDAARGVDVVYHVAAVYRDEGGPRQLFWDVNVEGTRRLLEAAKGARIKRFVHCSTVGVLGHIPHAPATEEAPYAPADHYQRSKRDGEVLALDFFRRERLPGTVIRPSGIYGPGDTRLLKLFRFIDRGSFRMVGTGQAFYHLTYIDDLVEGMRRAGESEAAVGEIFTIAGAEYVTLNELARRIAAALDKPLRTTHLPAWPLWLAGLACEVACRPLGISPPLYRRRVEFFTKSRAFDISKARRLLGYEPRVSLRDGLERTVRWYREQGLLS